MNKAPIAEIFHSIQGEGRSTGWPVVFVRFWGCNLRCRFRGVSCDTPFAVIDGRADASMMIAEEVANKIMRYNATHIVFTGGEPTLYQDFIVEVMNILPEHFTCEVETNGTNIIKPELKQVVKQFNVSVKLKSSNQESELYERRRINVDAIKSFPASKSYFKFVISSKNDLEEVEKISLINPEMEVWLMPEGYKREDVIEHSKETVELCLKKNWKFSPREHIIIWDNKRGV